MIEARNLTKWYGPALALDDVSFDVAAGEVLGFIGPNGAGKTTAMKILTTFIRPTAGRASVAGFDVLKRPLEVRRRIGYLPELNPLYNDMKVRESLSFYTDLRDIPRATRKAAIARAVAACGLQPVYEREIRELSKGYRQRVGLAQAIIHDPDILILDEPTSGLDPNQIVEVRSLIREIGRRKTVILSTHTLSEVALTANRIMVVHRGRLAASGTLDELRAKTAIPDSARVGVSGASAAEAAEAVGKISGVLSVEPCGSSGEFEEFKLALSAGARIEEEFFRVTLERGWRTGAFEIERASLEQVFNALTIGADKSAGVAPVSAGSGGEAANGKPDGEPRGDNIK
jgi:ABC-2 type transport system ATP-binding protein